MVLNIPAVIPLLFCQPPISLYDDPYDLNLEGVFPMYLLARCAYDAYRKWRILNLLILEFTAVVLLFLWIHSAAPIKPDHGPVPWLFSTVTQYIFNFMQQVIITSSTRLYSSACCL